MVTTSVLELGVSISMLFFLMSFCTQVMEKSMSYTNSLLEDIEKEDISALQKHLNETNRYIRGLGKDSITYSISILDKIESNQSKELIEELKEMQKELN